LRETARRQYEPTHKQIEGEESHTSEASHYADHVQPKSNTLYPKRAKPVMRLYSGKACVLNKDEVQVGLPTNVDDDQNAYSEPSEGVVRSERDGH